MSDETFYAIRRTDGEPMGDFGWMACDNAGDWQMAEDDSDGCDDGPIEYEIVLMRVESVAKRTFGDPRDLHVRGPHPDAIDGECTYCDEPWPCEFMADLEAATS